MKYFIFDLIRLTLSIITFLYTIASNAQTYPDLTDVFRLNQLEPPNGKVRMVLDTDTYNEIDDQFALAYAYLSTEKLQLEAVYAAPFKRSWHESDGQGMEESFQEIQRLLKFLGKNPAGFAFRGSDGFLKDISEPIQSEGVSDLISKAMASSPDDPLYVVPIGPLTNIASAILLEPKIIENIIVVWLGGHGLHWPTQREHNLGLDVKAAQVVFNSGVPLVVFPCRPVVSHFRTTIPELRESLSGKNELSDYLLDIFIEYAKGRENYSKEIWDVIPIAWLVNPSWIKTSIVHSPILTDQMTFSFDDSRHLIRFATELNRDVVFRDLFMKITK